MASVTINKITDKIVPLRIGIQTAQHRKPAANEAFDVIVNEVLVNLQSSGLNPFGGWHRLWVAQKICHRKLRFV